MQSLATRGRASRSPVVSMATAGMISTATAASSTVSLPLGPSLRASFSNPVPSISVVRKP